MKLSDNELRTINKALLYENEQLLTNNMMPDEDWEHWVNEVANKITDNVLLSKKIMKYIKGDDE